MDPTAVSQVVASTDPAATNGQGARGGGSVTESQGGSTHNGQCCCFARLAAIVGYAERTDAALLRAMKWCAECFRRPWPQDRDPVDGEIDGEMELRSR